MKGILRFLNNFRFFPWKSQRSVVIIWIPAAAMLMIMMLLTAGNRAHSSPNPVPAPSEKEAMAADSQSGISSSDRPVKRKPRKAVSWVALSQQYPGAFATRGPASPKRAALTFDDVPDRYYTPQVLDILAREKVKATFFIVGERAAAYPKMVQRIHKEGHAIGSHSYNHMSFARLSLNGFAAQIKRTDGVLLPQLGFTPRFMRPPYGEIKPEQLSWAQNHGYFVVNWNVDSEDWKGLSSNLILHNIKRTLMPGSIILQHAGGGIGEDLSGTVKALPQLITMLRKRGYQLVTVPELLGEPEAAEAFRLK